MLLRQTIQQVLSVPQFAVIEVKKRRQKSVKQIAIDEAWAQMSDLQRESWNQYAKSKRRFCVIKQRVISTGAKALFAKIARQRWKYDPDLPLLLQAPGPSGNDFSIIAKKQKKLSITLSSTVACPNQNHYEVLIQREGSTRLRTLTFINFDSELAHELKLPKHGSYRVFTRAIDPINLVAGEAIQCGNLTTLRKPKLTPEQVMASIVAMI